MAKYAIQSKHGAPPRGAYSQGWRAGDFIFVTGTGPIDPSTGNLVGDTIEQQTEQTIDNISAVLAADGLRSLMWSKSLCTSATPVISPAITPCRRGAFRSPIQCAPRLAAICTMPPGMLIEIDCIAYSTKKTGRKQSRGSTKQVARRRK
jgi:2-iminobutanoate/2-iminopropanoate deaminase